MTQESKDAKSENKVRVLSSITQGDGKSIAKAKGQSIAGTNKIL
jgi:hypothetical protein